MQIRELMTADPDACLAMDNCAAAGEIMRRRNCGFVPIVDNQATKRVIGVVTDRDVAIYLTKVNRPADQVRLEACMTRDVKTILPDASLEQAARLMETAAIHRLPVVDGEGRLIGVLSLKDIAVAADRRWAYAESRTAEQKLGEIIEAIASAR